MPSAKIVAIPLTPGEWERLERQARNLGLPISTYIRLVVEGQMGSLGLDDKRQGVRRRCVRFPGPFIQACKREAKARQIAVGQFIRLALIGAIPPMQRAVITPVLRRRRRVGKSMLEAYYIPIPPSPNSPQP